MLKLVNILSNLKLILQRCLGDLKWVCDVKSIDPHLVLFGYLQNCIDLTHFVENSIVTYKHSLVCKIVVQLKIIVFMICPELIRFNKTTFDLKLTVLVNLRCFNLKNEKVIIIPVFV